ncbi:MAG: carboxypeptidase regulatory-like domain-containing protein, partial [Rhodocyclaceae bacterium]|nr:carboxypeptidase regulatory-like domain-containing protein [Rhodocyclaceae bacterium]
LQVKPQFNLRLLFAETGGAYLADIRVRIQDSSGALLLDAVSQGPWFYAKLAPGRYRVSVDNAGMVQTRDVNVPAAGGVDLNFYW